jgi:hypothetical protein
MRVEFDGRMLRLFNTGHREEERLIDDLRRIGCTVYDLDDNKQQFRFSEFGGHLSIGLDGVVTNLTEAPKTPHVLECKTSNKKSFDALEKKGVLKAKPVHYDQMMLGMGMAELTRALYLVQCKDDDRLYMERIKFNQAAYDALLAKASRIIKSESPLEPISKKRDSYKCRFCDYASLCYGDRIADANCRTCAYSSPTDDGNWSCSQIGANLAKFDSCPEHLYIPDLLHWAEPKDAGYGWVEYVNNTNKAGFVNCAQGSFPAKSVPHYESTELQNCTPETVGNPTVEAAREILGGSVVETKKVGSDG